MPVLDIYKGAFKGKTKTRPISFRVATLKHKKYRSQKSLDKFNTLYYRQIQYVNSKLTHYVKFVQSFLRNTVSYDCNMILRNTFCSFYLF